MPKFIVIHGNIKTAGGWQHVGTEVELSDEERAHIDPRGELLATPQQFADLQAIEKAEKRLEESKKAAKAAPTATPAPKPTEPHKADKK